MIALLRIAMPLAAASFLAACDENAPEPSATGVQATMNQVSTPAHPFSLAPYGSLLSAHVDGAGLVDYPSFKQDAALLDAFIGDLGALPQSEYDPWDNPRQLAFWINAYNAITLKYILDNYPIKKGGLIAGFRFPANSIRQVSGVWDSKTTTVMGVPRTLDAIEHEILRVQFDEPRIHVAIVCAAKSCPPLRGEAYMGERIEEQLADQSRRFVFDPRNLRIDREEATVHLSSIFDWYGEDFVPVYGEDSLLPGRDKKESAVLRFCAKFLPENDAKYLMTETYRVIYADYDWALNEQ